MIGVNDFFDIVICLNLHNAYERWESVKSRFLREGIIVTRIEAIDKNSQLVIDKFHYHLKNNPETKIRRLGRFAIWLSFVKIFEYILSFDSIKTFLIFEDDILFHKDFRDLFSKSAENLPLDWKMWYLGATQVDINKGFDMTENIITINDSFFYRPNGKTFGMFGVGFKKDYLKDWLDRYKKGLKNNDHFFATEIEYDKYVYVNLPFLIGHSLGWSYNADYFITDSIAEKLIYFKYSKDIYI